MKYSIKGNIFLLMAAVVWGCGLVAQKAGMSHLGAFGFTAVRCTLGGVALLPLLFYMDKRKNEEQKKLEAGRKRIFMGSVCCGIALATLMMFQQLGLPYTTVGKAGFITALYILITPLMGILLGKKVSRNLWLGVVIGLAGMYMLCLFEGFSGVTFGDLMMLGAAVMASLHMHIVDYFVRTVDPVKLSAYQFIVTGLVSFIPALIFENMTVEAVVDCAVPVLYAGIVSCGFGYTFQVIGQKYTSPSIASLVLSMETVFSLLAGWVFFREVLTLPEYIGGGLMIAAIIVSQIPDRKKI